MSGLALASAGPAAAQPATSAATTASFSSLDGTAIPARVFLPASGAVPKGAVIALHGCGGLLARSGPRKGDLNARHQGMADLLVAEGYAAVFPDSLTPRGETELCTQRFADRRIDQRERRADALGALAWVAAQPWADRSRIALVGWSHGGSAVLAATDAGRAEVRDAAVKPAVAIAFYPGCGDPSRSMWTPIAPVVFMLGEKDDWTPAAPCVRLAERAGAEALVFAGAYHDFDNPVGTVRLRTDVPNGVNPGQGVHAGADPAAREAAYRRLREVLATAFAR